MGLIAKTTKLLRRKRVVNYFLPDAAYDKKLNTTHGQILYIEGLTV